MNNLIHLRDPFTNDFVCSVKEYISLKGQFCDVIICSQKLVLAICTFNLYDNQANFALYTVSVVSKCTLEFHLHIFKWLRVI